MEVSHTPVDKPTPRDVWTALNDLPQRVSSLLKKYESSYAREFEDFERQLHACSPKPSVRSPKRRSPATMWTCNSCSSTARCIDGPVAAPRSTSPPPVRWRCWSARSAGYWKLLAARQGAMLVSHLTRRDAEEVFATLGHMQPSKSRLDRLPTALSARWEAQREMFETTVREATVQVRDAGPYGGDLARRSDGAPMRGGYREAGCALASLVDADGERLHSVRMGRMLHSNKATLKSMVAAEVEAVLGPRPELTVVKLADGGKDNWTFLTRALPDVVELIDFYHAAEKFKDAFDAAHGADSPNAAAQIKKYRNYSGKLSTARPARAI